MAAVGVSPEEPEIAALLRVSSETGRGEKVYEYLHKLRSAVRCVSESTVKIVEDWFRGEKACEVGEVNWDVGEIREAVSRNGGGWHGRGWIGKGEWVVRRASVDSSGQCCCCGEKLFCVDINDEETERFAQAVSGLAMEREAKSNFSEFQVCKSFVEFVLFVMLPMSFTLFCLIDLSFCLLCCPLVLLYFALLIYKHIEYQSKSY